MNCYDEKIKKDIFRASTTYQNDYKKYCDYKREFYNYTRDRSEPPEKLPPPLRRDDNESFAKWKEDAYVPFDILLFPKPIIGTNPHKPFQKLKPLETHVGKEESIKTRPRVYMTPAVSMDDVPDLEMRKLICDRMYTTEWRCAEKEATAHFKRKIPSISKIEQVDTVKLKVELYKPLEERFRRLGKKWDDHQLRALTDPTREFWIHKDPPVQCGACVNPLKGIVKKDIRDEIKNLIENEKIRLPHDKPSPSYAGYKPRFPQGVPLSKVELPTIHPFLSTSQAITTRYAQDLKK